jgi:hypothetical protein
MMKRGKHNIRSYMTLEYQFSGIRIQDGFLSPVDWNLSVNLIATDKKGKLKEELELKAAATFQKLYFWLDTNLPGVVIVDVTSEDDLYLSNLSSNITMYCPNSPGDDILIQLLHSKLSSLAKEDLIVGEMQLKGSDSMLQYTFDCADSGYNLPVAVDEYYPEGEARDTIPWWSRDDGFCFEFIRPPVVEGEEPAEDVFKDIVDPMTEFDRIMSEVANTHIGLVKEPARIVQVEKWKPRKVE